MHKMINDYFRFAVFSPELRVGDVAGNCSEIIRLIDLAGRERAGLALFPELSITAYSCGDMFYNTNLLEGARQSLLKIAQATTGSGMVIIVGLPLRYCSVLYNSAAVLQNGRIVGVVPKSVLPNYREFYEKRHFKSGAELANCNLNFKELDYEIPFGTDLIFDDGGLFQLGVEICEDLWCINPPGGGLAAAGAKIIANLSATTEVAGKNNFRRNLVLQQSARLECAYLLSSAGLGESTTDVVFSGHLILAEHGELVAENQRFALTSDVIFGDVDLAALEVLRCSESSFADNAPAIRKHYRSLKIQTPPVSPDLRYANLPRNPFISLSWDYEDILTIQKYALIKRLQHLKTQSVVLGISGGLDSTLALLVAVESFRILNWDLSGIHAVSMPGLGTSGKTRGNVEILALAFAGVTFQEIDICEICRREFAAIGHAETNHNVVFENVQARSRTEILMNLANSLNALVLGTGDLSEIALGWNTYNGDHMSMYSLNCSLPKTVIQHVIKSYAASCGDADLRRVLLAVVETPISPELLPPASGGEIAQKTEDIIGAYELHDFFLYHLVRFGASAEKLEFLGCQAFAGAYAPEEIRRTLKIFLHRFYTQQFKRNCMPDGPKVCAFSLSPRGDWRMPSDMNGWNFELPRLNN